MLEVVPLERVSLQTGTPYGIHYLILRSCQWHHQAMCLDPDPIAQQATILSGLAIPVDELVEAYMNCVKQYKNLRTSQVLHVADSKGIPDEFMSKPSKSIAIINSCVANED